MDTIQLLIVADDPLAGAGLMSLVAEKANCTVAGQTSSQAIATELQDDIGHPPVDAILWDVGWEAPDPMPEWLETDLPVVALIADDLYAIEVWNAGIRALLRRDKGIERLVEAARAACQGLIVLDPELVSVLRPLILSETSPTEELTPRESEVLQLLTEGLTNKAIAQQLEISEHTVKFHVNAIMNKLAAQSRTEAVVKATRLGLISL